MSGYLRDLALRASGALDAGGAAASLVTPARQRVHAAPADPFAADVGDTPAPPAASSAGRPRDESRAGARIDQPPAAQPALRTDPLRAAAPIEPARPVLPPSATPPGPDAPPGRGAAVPGAARDTAAADAPAPVPPADAADALLRALRAARSAEGFAAEAHASALLARADDPRPVRDGAVELTTSTRVRATVAPPLAPSVRAEAGRPERHADLASPRAVSEPTREAPTGRVSPELRAATDSAAPSDRPAAQPRSLELPAAPGPELRPRAAPAPVAAPPVPPSSEPTITLGTIRVEVVTAAPPAPAVRRVEERTTRAPRGTAQPSSLRFGLGQI